MPKMFVRINSDIWRIKDQLDDICYFISLLIAQHVSDINISIVRSLRLCCWISTSVVLFSVRCALEIWCGRFWVVPVLQAEAQLCNTTDVVIQQHSRKLLMMDILMSETCWAHKKWNKIISDIKLVFYSSNITMMHGPINIRIYVHLLVYQLTKIKLCWLHATDCIPCFSLTLVPVRSSLHRCVV